MNFLTAVHTDVGIKKHTNQDSILIKEANTDYGKICLAVICDGMGGLWKGELASATLIRSFSKWFEEKFPDYLSTGMKSQVIQRSMEKVITTCGSRISHYAAKEHSLMGTTVVALLLTEKKYYVIHVGDSRGYELTSHMIQLTKDQTVVQREIDRGRMTKEEAQKDPRKNVLLQCVGASDLIKPAFYEGVTKKNSCYLLCSDGFYRVIKPQEIYQRLNPSRMSSEKVMENQLINLTELNKYRKEIDNISAVLIKTC